MKILFLTSVVAVLASGGAKAVDDDTRAKIISEFKEAYKSYLEPYEKEFNESKERLNRYENNYIFGKPETGAESQGKNAKTVFRNAAERSKYIKSEKANLKNVEAALQKKSSDPEAALAANNRITHRSNTGDWGVVHGQSGTIKSRGDSITTITVAIQQTNNDGKKTEKYDTITCVISKNIPGDIGKVVDIKGVYVVKHRTGEGDEAVFELEPFAYKTEELKDKKK